MNNEQLKDILIAKIKQEFSIYKQDLIKKCTKEEKALLSTEKVLEKMYDKYMNIETNNLDNMRDIVQEIVEDIDKEFTKKREKAR